MKVPTNLSISAIILLASATPNDPTLLSALESLKYDPHGIRMLGHDGVLRRFNGACDEVLDYIQLSASHIAEYTQHYPPEAREIWSGVDGRAVTDEAQLWSVPDGVPPCGSTTKVKKDLSPLDERDERCTKYACDEPTECRDEYNCAECEIFYECTGGPMGCSTFKRCDDTLKSGSLIIGEGHELVGS